MPAQETDAVTKYLIGGILSLIVAIVAVEQLALPFMDGGTPKQNAECRGEPIHVDYEFTGGMLEPHACAEQCDDGQWRYIVYADGQATQCQKPPGCSDWGEDSGVTCTLPEEGSEESLEER